MKMFRLMFAAALFAPMPLLAASPFDGTWKIDSKQTQMSTKPNVYLLKDGTYTCDVCVPTLVVPADGKFHKVTGHPYFDEYSVTVVDAHTIKTASRKDGKLATSSTRTVSADDKTTTSSFSDVSAANGVPVTGKTIAVRVAKGPPGSHAVSGSWQSKPTEMSNSALLMTVSVVGDKASFSTPTGVSYSATLDGPAAPVVGDPGWTTVKVKRAGAAIVETDLFDGKPLSEQTMTVAADGKSMKIVSNDLRRNRTTTDVAVKQ